MLWTDNYGKEELNGTVSQFSELLKLFGDKPVIISEVIPMIMERPKNLCCFPICKVFKEIFQSEELQMELLSGALVIEDIYDHPMIVSHCVIKVTKLEKDNSKSFQLIMDPSFEGPSSYGAPSDCEFTFIEKGEIVSRFIELSIDPTSLPQHVSEGIDNGVENVNYWWEEELCQRTRDSIVNFIQLCDTEIITYRTE